MSLAPFVRILGRGPGRSRALSEQEAEEAMALLLAGDAAPKAVGALLMLLRFRGESAPEIAGFTRALRASVEPWRALKPALDWPCYAAGRSRGLPWFLLAVRTLAEAGYPVLLHGQTCRNGEATPVAAALDAAGIPVVQSPEAAGEALSGRGMAFVPLPALSPAAERLLALRDVLGLRSAINTVLRMCNPGDAATSVQGVFHPPYRPLQQRAGMLLSDHASLVIKGGGGEFERHPGKDIALFGQRCGTAWRAVAPALIADEAVRLADGPDAGPDPMELASIWSGRTQDGFAESIVSGTIALALLAAGVAEDCHAADALSVDLWERRDRSGCV